MEPLGPPLTIVLRGAAYGEALARLDLPEGRLVAVALGEDLAAPPPLLTERWHPDERALLEGMAPRRARTWVGGRLALRLALQTGLADGAGSAAPILADDRGAPSLAPDLSGSIAHKDPIAVALVGRAAAERSADPRRVGVDVELAASAPTLRLTSKILRPDEADLLSGDEESRARALLLAFSAKEAIYKAIDPFVRRYVGFHEVRLRGEPGCYAVEPMLKTAERLRIEARAFVAGDVVLALATAERA